jgi:hypothetical protein
MTDEQILRDIAQQAEGVVDDQRTFAGNAVQFAKDRNFKAFHERIRSAIEMAECLPRDLRSLKRFIDEHPELDKGGF